ncbi:transglutaminase-like cysteine peptidase [Microvirga sp. G4-2]|uniref:transglutaminase-like cysteine peptidase n=1 Tax=Microvirga sp. G4-2 TaxID=3434467 RepID=UPI004044152F
MFSILRSVAAACLLVVVASPIHAAVAKPARQVVLAPERLAELQQVNRHVNATIVETTDLEQYGREDAWTLPASGRGDCEDFVLLKRKMLIERG